MGDKQQRQGGQNRGRDQTPRQQTGGQPQQPQQGGKPDFERDKSRMGNKPGMGPPPGQDWIGRDHDDDSKIVQPGEKPGQSHGTDQIRK